ncbi:MAG: phage tail tape measure protein [Flavobacteriaceae bacterium]|nr:phage tail tape measure protein [Flavobacteriaceae bacterium]
MDNTLNYNIKFQTNADRITAGVDKLDKTLNKAGRGAMTLGQKFGQAMQSMNSKLNTIRIDSLVNNIGHAANGLNAMSAPGLKLTSELADLSAIAGVTGKGLDEIEGYARQNAVTFGGDAAAGINSYKLILSQLGPEIAKVPQGLKAMGDNVSILSKTMGGDTAAATEVLTTAMNQFQVSTADPIKASKEMADMMNIMAAAAKEGSAELPQQKAALEQSGMAAKAANVSFAETAAAIQVLDKAGKKGSEGGVALRNTMAVLSQGRFLPKDVQEELKAAGVDVNVLGDKSLTLADRLRPLKGIMNDSALVTKLFGRENSNAALALVSGIDEQERLTEKIQGTNTAMEQAAIVMASPEEIAKRLTARIDDMKISFFNATGGTMAYVSVLGNMAFDVGNLIPLFSASAKAIAFMTNATKLQALWTGITTTATSVWTGAQWLLNAAMTANPIGVIIMAIAALVAGIVWLVSNVEGFGEYWDHTWKGAKLIFSAVVEGFKVNFNAMVDGIMIGINAIKFGWYKFKEVMGIGDSTENQNMIAQIQADTVARMDAIKEGQKKVAKIALEGAKELTIGASKLKWKNDGETSEASADAGGIAAPNPSPGTEGSSAGTAGGKTGENDKTKTNTAIATGGTKHNYITITMKDLIGVLNIKGNDFKDSAKQMQDQSADALMRTLALAVTAGS